MSEGTMAPTEKQMYAELRHFPRPRYPFPDRVSPWMEELAAECNEWVDADCPFESAAARERHKRHRLTDIAARAFPGLSLEELRPIGRFTAFLAILDDYMDHSSRAELERVRERVAAILTGREGREPEAGFYRQVHRMRQEALACGMPGHLYQEFASSVFGLMTGFGDEKRHNAANRPPRLAEFQAIRWQTSGGLTYAKYLCMQGEHRRLPWRVLGHGAIARMHRLAATLIGYHNDFISLPKELARKGDVVNVVLAVQHELGTGLREAYETALGMHDELLAEFVELQQNLPNFGEWQGAAREYAADLGVMVQGVYAWHVENTGRYSPGAYVEPEHEPERGPEGNSGQGPEQRGPEHEPEHEPEQGPLDTAGVAATAPRWTGIKAAGIKAAGIVVVAAAALASPLAYGLRLLLTATRLGAMPA